MLLTFTSAKITYENRRNQLFIPKTFVHITVAQTKKVEWLTPRNPSGGTAQKKNLVYARLIPNLFSDIPLHPPAPTQIMESRVDGDDLLAGAPDEQDPGQALGEYLEVVHEVPEGLLVARRARQVQHHQRRAARVLDDNAVQVDCRVHLFYLKHFSLIYPLILTCWVPF